MLGNPYSQERIRWGEVAPPSELVEAQLRREDGAKASAQRADAQKASRAMLPDADALFKSIFDMDLWTADRENVYNVVKADLEDLLEKQAATGDMYAATPQGMAHINRIKAFRYSPEIAAAQERKKRGHKALNEQDYARDKAYVNKDGVPIRDSEGKLVSHQDYYNLVDKGAIKNKDFNININKYEDTYDNIAKKFEKTGEQTLKNIRGLKEESLNAIISGKSTNIDHIRHVRNAMLKGDLIDQRDWNTLVAEYYSRNPEETDQSKAEQWAMNSIVNIATGKYDSMYELDETANGAGDGSGSDPKYSQELGITQAAAGAAVNGKETLLQQIGGKMVASEANILPIAALLDGEMLITKRPDGQPSYRLKDNRILQAIDLEKAIVGGVKKGEDGKEIVSFNSNFRDKFSDNEWKALTERIAFDGGKGYFTSEYYDRKGNMVDPIKVEEFRSRFAAVEDMINSGDKTKGIQLKKELLEDYKDLVQEVEGNITIPTKMVFVADFNVADANDLFGGRGSIGEKLTELEGVTESRDAETIANYNRQTGFDFGNGMMSKTDNVYTFKLKIPIYSEAALRGADKKKIMGNFTDADVRTISKGNSQYAVIGQNKSVNLSDYPTLLKKK